MLIRSTEGPGGAGGGRTPASEPTGGTDPVVAAVRALTLASARFRHVVAERIGVDLSATMVMSHLSQSGPSSPRELARKVGLTPSAMTSALDRLEAAGLAVRTPHPTDRRKAVVALTDTGQATLVRVRTRLRAAVDAFDDDRLDEATEIVRTLAGALDAQAEALERGATF